MDAHNILNVPAGEVEVGEGPEVVWERDAAPLLKVALRFSDEVKGQPHHDGSSRDECGVTKNTSARMENAHVG